MKNFILILVMLITGLTINSLKAQGSWTIQANPLGSNNAALLGKIQFVSQTEGWISVSSGGLLHTTNAGVNWTLLTPFPNETVWSLSDPDINMCFVNPTTGWLIKSFGTSEIDLHGVVVYKTTNGGNNWQRIVLSQNTPDDLGLQIQFVDDASGESDPHYIMASLNRKVYDLSMRVNVSITPELSIQYYAQPYIFAGEYTDYKEITDPRADEFQNRYHQYTNNEISYNEPWNAYLIDEDQNGDVDYGFYKPDFHYLQFKSNMVFRWEYKRGSSLYMVWSQGRTEMEEGSEEVFSQYAKDLWNTPAREHTCTK